MLNAFMTVFINWILLIIVLIYFTPAIFPAAAIIQGGPSQG